MATSISATNNAVIGRVMNPRIRTWQTFNQHSIQAGLALLLAGALFWRDSATRRAVVKK